MLESDDEGIRAGPPVTPPSTPTRGTFDDIPATPGKSPGRRRSKTAFTERLIRANQQRIESKFEGCTTKEQIIKRIVRYRSDLLFVPLTLPSVSSGQLSKDFQRERVLLNGVAFIPDKQDTYRNNSFVATLNMLISRLVAREGMHCITPVGDVGSSSSGTGVVVPHEPRTRSAGSHPPTHTPTIESLTNIILQRASRTGCGSDSFFMVQKLFCIEGTFVTQKVETTDEPIKMHVFIDRKVRSADGSTKTSSASAGSRAEEFHQQYVYNANQLQAGHRHIRSPSSGSNVLHNIASTLEKLAQPPAPLQPPLTLPLPPPSKSSSTSTLSSSSPTPGGPFGGSPRAVAGTGAGQRKHSGFTPTIGAEAANHSTSNTSNTPPPIPEDLSGGLCCIVTVANNFNIADISCLENVTEDRGPDVWLTVSTVVTDESNFKTGHFSRHVSITVATPYGSGSRVIERAATLKQELLDTRHLLHSMLHSRNVSRAMDVSDRAESLLDSSSDDGSCSSR
jgi:hypothetical protein